MKALHKTVLPRAARRNVEGLDLLRLEPALHHLGDELRTVVAPQMLRRPGLLHGLLQPGQLHDAVGREVQVWQKFAARSRDYVPSEIVLGRSVKGGREVSLN